MGSLFSSELDFNEFWERKMKTFFNTLDVKDRGWIQSKDCDVIAELFITLAKLDKESSQAKQIRYKWKKIWKDQLEAHCKLGVLTQGAFMRALRKQGPINLTLACYRYSGFLYDLIDVNGSGSVSQAEFDLFCKLFQINEDSPGGTFARLEKDRDGTIGEDEFLKALYDFFLGTGPTPYSYLFGPLVEE